MVGSSDAVSPGVPLSPLSPSLERKKSDYPDGEAKVGGQTQKEEGKQAGDTREDGRPAFADAGSLSPVGGMEREREKGAGGLSRAFARAGARLTSALVLSEDEENTTERAEGGAQTDTVGDSGKDKSSHDEMPSTKAKPQPNRGGRRLLAGGETGNEGRIPEKSQPENERVPSSCLSRQRQQRRGKGGQGQGREKEKEKDNGSLWGEFDEEGEHQQFLKALEEWRAGRKQAAGADSSSQVAKGTEMTEEGEDETSSSAMQPLGDWTEKVLFSSDQNEMEEGTIMGENSAAEAAQKGKVSASPEILSQLCQRGSHVLPSSSSSNNLSASQTLGKNKKEKGNTNNPTQFVRGGPPPGWSLRPSASLSSNSDPHASTSQTEDTSPKNEGQILSSLVVQSSLRARPDAEVCVGHLKHGKHGVPSYTGKTAAGSRKAKTRPTPRGTCVSVPPKHEKKPPSRASKKEMEIQTEGMGTQTEGGLEEGKERERECFDQQPAVPPSCPTAPECEEVRFPLSPSGVAALHTTEWRRWTVGPDGQHRQTITASSVDIEAVCSASCAALQGKGGGKGEGGGSLGDSGKEFGDSKFQQQSFEGGGYIQKKRESAGRGLESVNEPKGGQEKKVEAHSEKETTGAEAMQDAGLKFWALTGTESIRVRTPVEGVKRRPAPPPSPAGGTGNGTAAQGKPVSLSPLWSADLNNVEGGQGGGIKSFRTHQQIPSWKTKTRDAETSAGEEDGEAMEKTQGPERRGRVLRSRGLRINTDIPDLDTETETGTGESCAVAEEEKTRRLRLEQFAIDRETLALQAEAEETAAKTRQRKREIEMGRKMEEERRDGDVESDSMGEQSDRLLSSSSSSAIMASFQALAESLSAVRQKEGLGGFLVEPKGPEKEGKRESEGMEGKTKGQSQTEFERESQGEKDSLSLGNMALFFQAVGKGRA
uniref:Uncharacterized protein n=1 Tax=Chromera velia CCMP2878 TaxID=1169474 RepID=A0A0G4G9K3_9ALVE|eukprot:Cvel_20887.t1-p1 / transcript=Cvel_20887.t1 / gene=Cvel_20887 / organism=Chromera_velia_CCMP2878 / gene_product=hypothetical protein / transcript_product=hypothetical protein / location=Cvel_scaffold1915:12735-19021(-) / protein_length=933 / sequence_SO=supercontig / SO=protein_coding / is_pseudo=false